MSKFKIRLRLQGLELEIEGSREDVPLIAQNVGAQVAGLLQPITDIVEGETPRTVPVTPITVPPGEQSIQRKKRTARKRATPVGQGVTDGGEPHVVEYAHDAVRWGKPKQEWSLTKKALWLLYVLREQMQISEMTSRQIADTFNKYFRDAGAINIRNVARDLPAAAGKNPAQIGKNDSGEVRTWHLTQAGEVLAKALAAEASGKPEPAPAGA